jgi:hypothetical protein
MSGKSMKEFTSIHNCVSWRFYNFRCVHELEEAHILEVLDALRKDGESREATLEFVQELRKGKCSPEPTDRSYFSLIP